jgi:hypothetical protein
MANTVYPSGSIGQDQGSTGNEWMLTVEVVDTDGEVQLTHGGCIFLDSSSAALAVTMPADMAVGSTWVITAPAGATHDAVLTLPSGVTWDGTNDAATFDAAGETIIAHLISTTRLWVANISALTFS